MHAASRWAWILFAGGGLALLATHWLNRPAVWRPLVIAAPTETIDLPVELAPGRDYEVSIEFRRDIGRSDYRQLIAPQPQSLLDGEWTVGCSGAQVAGGETADYLRIRRVQSWKGETYRVVARVPFGVDEAKYRSFGVAGQFLSERVVGRLTVPDVADGNCTFRWLPKATIDGTRIVIRRSEDDWRTHARRYSILAIVGVGSLCLGFAVGVTALVVGRLRPRSSSATH
jgi:hypothetical protein